MSGNPKKSWLAFGTGVGIEIGSEDLKITMARLRPAGIKVLGWLRIHRFREQAAAEWGQVYSRFLKKAGAGHLSARVLLPRQEVIVRQIALPGVADRDLEAAIRFQIDSLHPFSEEEAVWTWARIAKTGAVLVAITRREVIDEYSALFAEAGIKVTDFTLGAASLHSALRLYGSPPQEGFLGLEPEGEEWEIYGESPARPLFSARLEQPFDRAKRWALAELRLPDEAQSAVLHEVLPQPLAAPEDYRLADSTLAYATAVSGAAPWRGLSVNLLPRDLRQNSSRMIYIPTIVLAILIALTVGAMAAYSNYEERDYSQFLQQQIRRVQPRAAQADDIDRRITWQRNQAQVLDNFRKRSKDDLDALNDLARILPATTWLTSLQLTRDAVSLSGQAEHAEGLLKQMDNSRQFRKSSFTLPMTRINNAETFSIHAAREGITP